MALSFFEIGKNINAHGNRIDAEEEKLDAFMLNRLYSMTPDTIHFANEMNRHYEIPRQWVYDFYRFGLDRNPRRYGTWVKKKATDEDIEAIIEAYGVSKSKAQELYPILKDRIELIYDHIRKGGAETVKKKK